MAHVVGAAELVPEARAFVAPPGTPMPDLRDAHMGFDDEWTQFTVTELLRQKPANHVRVILERSGSSAVATYDAAVAHRQIDGTAADWPILVEGNVMFQFAFIFENEGSTDASKTGRCSTRRTSSSSRPRCSKPK